MVDRLIAQGLSVIVVGLIALTFGGALLLGYRALYESLSGHVIAGSVLLAAASPLALSARMMARHKDDLMDR